MNSQAQPKSIDQIDVTQMLGLPQGPQLGATIRLLVWNMRSAFRDHEAVASTGWQEELVRFSSEKDLILFQVAVPGHQASNAQTDVGMEIQTNCVADAQKHELHRAVREDATAKMQGLFLESHYAIAGSKKTLMVLNLCSDSFGQLDAFQKQLEQLNSLLEQHSGAVLLAGDFDSLSGDRLSLFRKCAARANLFETSLTRQSKLASLNQQLDYVFFRGLSLTSLESLSHSSPIEHAPIAATFK